MIRLIQIKAWARIRELREIVGSGDPEPVEYSVALACRVDSMNEDFGIRGPTAAGPIRVVAPRASRPIVPLSGMEG